MAAKARVTVRLSPSSFHALAYLAEREGYTPAEISREILAAGVLQTLAARGWGSDWRASWGAWQAEQGARPQRYEVPEQALDDARAPGGGVPAPRARPLADTVAADSAHITRVADQLAARKAGR